MNKKILRIITIMATIIFVVCSASMVFATLQTPSEVGSSITDTDKFDSVGAKILGAIRSIAMLISIGVIIVIGIKYMMGSAEEKAEYKKTLLPYLIGAVLVFAASGIASMIFNFATSISAG